MTRQIGSTPNGHEDVEVVDDHNSRRWSSLATRMPTALALLSTSVSSPAA
jgi:hypothetical protein